MRQRVGAEHLRAQHQEVADEAGGQRDEGAGEQRVLHERLGHANRPRAYTRPRTSRYSANETVVSQKPTGYTE